MYLFFLNESVQSFLKSIINRIGKERGFLFDINQFKEGEKNGIENGSSARDHDSFIHGS